MKQYGVCFEQFFFWKCPVKCVYWPACSFKVSTCVLSNLFTVATDRVAKVPASESGGGCQGDGAAPITCVYYFGKWLSACTFFPAVNEVRLKIIFSPFLKSFLSSKKTWMFTWACSSSLSPPAPVSSVSFSVSSVPTGPSSLSFPLSSTLPLQVGGSISPRRTTAAGFTALSGIWAPYFRPWGAWPSISLVKYLPHVSLTPWQWWKGQRAKHFRTCEKVLWLQCAAHAHVTYLIIFIFTSTEVCLNGN